MSKPTENSGRMDCDFKSLLIIIKCTKFKSLLSIIKNKTRLEWGKK